MFLRNDQGEFEHTIFDTGHSMKSCSTDSRIALRCVVYVVNIFFMLLDNKQP